MVWYGIVNEREGKERKDEERRMISVQGSYCVVI
jgi:hypothetical protein